MTNVRQALPRCISLAFIAALPAIAQPNMPFVFSVENSANYGNSIAQGSLFVVFGANIGPAQLAEAASYPLPPQIGGTSITITSGLTMLVCPMVYSTAGEVAAILPSNTPPGTASLSLTYNGQITPFPVPVTVVPSAMGLYTLSSSGLGPGSVTALTGAINNFAIAAQPGETLTAWGTGLGPINGSDFTLPSSFPNFPGVEVFVGAQPAKVIYAGRSGCCGGVDQVSFQVPPGLAGCYVPVAVRSGGKISNFVSIAVSSDGGPCSDTAPTIPVSVMNHATAGESVRAAALAVGPISVLRGLGFDQNQYLAETLSKLLRVKVSPDDVAKLLLAGQTHNRKALNRAMVKYAKSWKALDPASKAAVSAAVNLSQEGAYAVFAEFTTPGTVGAAVSGLFPSQGTCTVITSLTAEAQRSGMRLDAGSSLALSGSAGSWTLAANRTGQYQVVFGSAPTGPNVPPGAYTIFGAGGHDLVGFSATLKVGGNIVWTNKPAASSIDRSQPLTVTWSGGTTPGDVWIGGYVESQTTPFIGFVCAEDIAKGSFTIPSLILSALPAAANGGAMFIGSHPLSQPVVIPGVDLSYFIDGSSDSESVVYR